jgi:hypothetical protein
MTTDRGIISRKLTSTREIHYRGMRRICLYLPVFSFVVQRFRSHADVLLCSEAGSCIMTTCEYTNLRYSNDNDRTVNPLIGPDTRWTDLQAHFANRDLSSNTWDIQLPSWILSRSHDSNKVYPHAFLQPSSQVLLHRKSTERRAITYKCDSD